jgi:hypothetical protein
VKAHLQASGKTPKNWLRLAKNALYNLRLFCILDLLIVIPGSLCCAVRQLGILSDQA